MDVAQRVQVPKNQVFGTLVYSRISSVGSVIDYWARGPLGAHTVVGRIRVM